MAVIAKNTELTAKVSGLVSEYDIRQTGYGIQREFAVFINNMLAMIIANKEHKKIDQIYNMINSLKALSDPGGGNTGKKLLGIFSVSRKPRQETIYSLEDYKKVKAEINDITALLNEFYMETSVNWELYKECAILNDKFLVGIIQIIDLLSSKIEYLKENRDRYNEKYIEQYERVLENFNVTKLSIIQNNETIRFISENNQNLHYTLNSLLSHTIPLWDMEAAKAVEGWKNERRIKNQQAVNYIFEEGDKEFTSLQDDEELTVPVDSKKIMKYADEMTELMEPLVRNKSDIEKKNDQLIEELNQTLSTISEEETAKEL